MKACAAFILGCQRSGTTMLQDVLAGSPDCRSYGEEHPAAMHDYRLLDVGAIKALLAGGGGLPVFKPICDSHFGDEILRRYPSAKLIWIYRRYRDVTS